jgi:hypothetical protein
MTTKLANGHRIFQIATRYTNIFHSKANKKFKNIPKLGNCTIWQPVSFGKSPLKGVKKN